MSYIDTPQAVSLTCESCGMGNSYGKTKHTDENPGGLDCSAKDSQTLEQINLEAPASRKELSAKRAGVVHAIQLSHDKYITRELELFRRILNGDHKKGSQKCGNSQSQSTESKVIADITKNMPHRISKQSFDLSSIQITQFPSEIFTFSKITALDLSNNHLSDLPEALMTLRVLTNLNLSKNALGDVPKALFSMKSLQVLDLSRNMIRRLPLLSHISIHLRVLDISFNNIQFLPGILCSCHNLQINIFSNPLLVAEEYLANNCEDHLLTLQEVARRNIYNNSKSFATQVAWIDLKYSDQKVCSFCGQVYHESSVLKIRFVSRNYQTIPFAYELCRNHWNNEREMIREIFYQPESRQLDKK